MPLIGTSTSASAKGYGMLASGYPVAGNPSFSNVSLLLHGDGTNGAQNNTFVDSSPSALTVTRSGNTTQGSFNPYGPVSGIDYSPATYGGSAYFDGPNSNYYLTIQSSTALNLSSGDFTIECWFYSTASGIGQTIMNKDGVRGSSCSQWDITISASNTISFGLGNGNGTSSCGTAYDNTTTISTNTWYHIAITRAGSTIKTFVNGTQTSSNTQGVAMVDGGKPLYIGYQNGFPENIFKGYITNVRIVKGTALYTSTFTPPTAPLSAVTNTTLLLNFANAGIFDNAAKNNLITAGSAQVSSAQVKFGTGSMLFNGTTDYLLSPSSASASLGTGDFTIEFWVNPSSVASESVIVDLRSGSASVGPTVGFSAGGAMYFQTSGTSVITGSTLPTSTWTHVAVSRSSNNTRLFVNGVQYGSTYSTAYTPTNPARVCIGSRDNGTFGLYFNGYIDDLRITKGVAVYTQNFTPYPQAFPNS